MLQPKDYIAPWPDFNYPDFSAWLAGVGDKWGDKDAVLYRGDGRSEFTRWSFSTFVSECRRIGRGLLAAGLAKGDRVALWCENRPEWMAVWAGTAASGFVITPIEFTASDEECLNILTITGARAFFYSAKKKAFANSLAALGVKAVCVCMTGEDEGCYSFFGRSAGGKVQEETPAVSGSDPASIVFTSGTTGFAKGVTLSHRNILANANAAVLSLGARSEDVFAGMLPLHHTYPATCSFIAPLLVGASTIIVERPAVAAAAADIQDGGGTFLIAVPLFYDKVKASIERNYNALPGIARFFLDILRSISLSEAKRGNVLFGRKCFRFIRKKAKLQSLRIMVSGGGPLSPKTADFLDSFGFNIVQGYGLSENGPLVSVNTTRHKRNASAGLPVKYTEVMILAPDSDGTGEIAVKSPSVMLGYYANPEASAQIMSGDGWLRTGDVGYTDEDGFLYISGRDKNIIVSQGGKNIYPEEVESHFSGSEIIAELLVVGRKEKDGSGEEVYAAVFPDFERIKAAFPGKDKDEAFVKELVKREIDNVNRKLPGYKKITGFVVRSGPFKKNAQHKVLRYLYKGYSETQ